jgi:hypothetical protein
MTIAGPRIIAYALKVCAGFANGKGAKYLTLTGRYPPTGKREGTRSPDTPPSPIDPLLGKNDDRRSTANNACRASSVANARPARTNPNPNNTKKNVSYGTGATSSAQPQSAYARNTRRAARVPTSVPIPLETTLAQGGFPSYENEPWADPIAASQSSAVAAKTAAKTERLARAQNERAGRTRRRSREPERGGNSRGEKATTAAEPIAPAAATAATARAPPDYTSHRPRVQPAVEEAQPPPGGPGELWGDSSEPW